MKFFRWKEGEDPPDVPPELMSLIEGLTEMIRTNVGEAGIMAIVGGEILGREDMSDEVRADHDRVEHLAHHLHDLGEDVEGFSDGNKLRFLAAEGYRRAVEGGGCVHESPVPDALLGMADRLDELDLKEIGV